MTNIDISIAKKVLELVDAGLVKGVGVPEPGNGPFYRPTEHGWMLIAAIQRGGERRNAA